MKTTSVGKFLFCVLVAVVGEFQLSGANAVTTSAAQTVFRRADVKRIAQIAEMLPERSGFPLTCISNRIAWRRLALSPQGGKVIRQAEKLLTEQIPEPTDEQYLEFSTPGNGNRSNYHDGADPKK